MEASSYFKTVVLGRKRDKNPKTTNTTVITKMKGNKRIYYVLEYGKRVGVIYTGTEGQCRTFLINNQQYRNTGIIMDEDEYNKVKNWSKERINSYIAKG